jgi:WD40 repeat protein
MVGFTNEWWAVEWFDPQYVCVIYAQDSGARYADAWWDVKTGSRIAVVGGSYNGFRNEVSAWSNEAHRAQRSTQSSKLGEIELTVDSDRSFDQPDFILRGHTGVVQSLHFRYDSNYLASGSSDSTVRLWDVKKVATLATLTGHVGSVRCVQFNPDGSTLASCGDDTTIKLWDVSSLPTNLLYLQYRRTYLANRLSDWCRRDVQPVVTFCLWKAAPFIWPTSLFPWWMLR